MAFHCQCDIRESACTYPECRNGINSMIRPKDPTAHATQEQKRKAFEWLRRVSVGLQSPQIRESAAIMMYEHVRQAERIKELEAQLALYEPVGFFDKPKATNVWREVPPDSPGGITLYQRSVEPKPCPRH